MPGKDRDLFSKGRGILSDLQRLLLDRLQKDLPDFYLTGGSALGEFYLGHRVSQDLDLFTTRLNAFDSADVVVRNVALEFALEVSVLRSGTGFRRYLLTRGEEQLVLDVVHETVEQLDQEKPVIEGLRVDTVREITANKLCAVVGRSELKDLIDLYFIEKTGVNLLDLLNDAQRKDGGLTPATLAYTLSQISTSGRLQGLLIPVSKEDLTRFRDRLVDALTRMAFPK